MTTKSTYTHARQSKQENDFIPHDVVGATIDGATPIRAWRAYLRLTQAEVAARLGVSQSVYACHENSKALPENTIRRVAAALGITEEQLDFL
jgi:predicted transcriptional regulator